MLPLTLGEGLLRRAALFGECLEQAILPLPVYSDRTLVPRRQRGTPLVVELSREMVSCSYRRAQIDIRNIRCIHTISEGRAARLIAEKVGILRHRLAEYQHRYPADWALRGDEIVEVLTRGDKNDNDLLRVAQVRQSLSDSVLLLNGHRRLAALCWLAANGEIPLGWLQRIPALLHKVDKQYVARITADVCLETTSVLREVEIGGVSPALGYAAFQNIFCDHSRRNDIQPYDLADLQPLLDGNQLLQDEIDEVFFFCATSTCAEAIFKHLFPYWLRSAYDLTRGPLFRYFTQHPELDEWVIAAWPIILLIRSHDQAMFLAILYRSHPAAVTALVKRAFAECGTEDAYSNTLLKQLAANLGITLV